jgi:tRNA threonylcarbamoyladenosine biosynthesis protein TsaE
MKAVIKPLLQRGFGGRQVNTRHANLRKSELLGPGPYLDDQLTAAELTVAEGGGLHGAEPIVKSSLHLIWPTESATQIFAESLAVQPALRNAFIELRGDLGAGKTTFTRHLLRALGVEGRIKSPTFAVVEPYDIGGLQIWHFDFYRFTNPREWADAGFRDIFASDGLKLAEWPENAAPNLPLADVVLQLEVMDDESRRATVTAQTEVGLALMRGMNA